MSQVRIRFAPSPTGPLHIGGVRTALYNYLFAKKNNGKFILRIEDTDQNRYVDGAEKYIIESLNWLGINFDESPAKGGEYGPYRQSERKSLYGKYANQLIESGHAYYAFDSADELTAMKERYKEQGIHTPKYDAQTRMSMNNSLTLSDTEVQTRIQVGENVIVRLKLEPNEIVHFEDEVRGEVSFNTSDLDDKVLLKADGMPTYHMANIVDDHLMKISHVIRGEEWLPSTAHHVLLYRALGWANSMPKFAHLPLILKPVGNGKLNKRDGAKFGFPVFPLTWEGNEDDESFIGFREFGFDPKATLNFLAFVGWNPGTEQEIFSMEELVESFSIPQIVKSGARFDIEKAKWYNQQYILNQSDEELVEPIKHELAKHGIDKDDSFVQRFAGLMKERVSLYTEFYSQAKYFFQDIETYDEKMIRKKWKGDNIEQISTLFKLIETIEDWSVENLQDTIKGYIAKHELSFGNVLPLLRIATSGTTKGPDVFQMMALMDKDMVIGRLSTAPAVFEKVTGS